MSSGSANLGLTISNLTEPNNPLPPLPLSHVTSAENFSAIVNKGSLTPLDCDVFGEPLIYFFYGGVFYRPATKRPRKASEQPVAFVFSPEVASTASRFYPFDTGAMASGRFGKWSRSLAQLRAQFEVSANASYGLVSKMVYYLFGNNRRYLSGQPDPENKKRSDPLPLLFDFYTDNLGASGVDHRQLLIECQFKHSVSLDVKLLWVGYPKSKEREFVRLYKQWLQPTIPQKYPYKAHKARPPADIASELEGMARRDVIERYMSMP